MKKVNQIASEEEEEILLIRGEILLRWLFWASGWCPQQFPAPITEMLVQNNYLLAKNDRTLTLQTYWILIACLQAMSGVIQFCLRRTIYYERWVEKASFLIAHQNHYRGTERVSAGSGQTRQHWSRLPRDKIQFTLLEATGQRAISPGNRAAALEWTGINNRTALEPLAYARRDL